jgi:Rap1-interacting factor 1 N terminal
MSLFGLTFFRRASAVDNPVPAPNENEDVEEGLDLAIDFLGSGSEVEQHLNSPTAVAATPQTSSPSSNARHVSTPQQLTSSLRKVTFEAVKECDFHYSSSPSRVLSPLRPLPPSQEQPAKSILKPFTPSALNTVNRKIFGSFQDMLDNIVRQLAAGDQRNRIDAYQAFLSAVQAKISVPEQDALLDVAPSLLEFIYRDIQNPSSQNLQIVTSALKFLATLVRLIPTEEQVELVGLSSLLDLSISVIEKTEAPKVVTHHHLLFLCQKFSLKLLTSERISRILTLLNKIHDRVQGNNIKVYRLVIYHQFCELVPNTMITRSPEWLPNVLSGMISYKSEVRSHALNLGMLVSLRHARQLCVCLEEMFATKGKTDDITFMTHYVQQLNQRLDHQDREVALAVPRVWVVIAMFLRFKFKKEEFWPWFKPWLTLLSRAMNSPDRQLRVEGYTAWKRFIFAVMPDKLTLTRVRKMLRSPFQDSIVNQRELQQGLGRTMMSGYLCLLYYALRPNATFEDLDHNWNDYVLEILIHFPSAKRGGQHLQCAALILQSLFQSQEKWNENRANSLLAFEIDELPRIDPSWIRSRLDKVLPVVETILLHPSSWIPVDEDNSDQERPLYSDNLALYTWSCLMAAVREAGAKEITMSAGLKSSIAATMNTLHKTGRWLAQNPPKSIHPAQAFQLLAECAMTRLGASSFTDRILMKNPESQSFEIAPTPSHRPKFGYLQSPFTHLLMLLIELSSQPNLAMERAKSAELVQSTIDLCWNALSLRTSKLTLLGDLLETLELEYARESSIPPLALETADHVLELAEEITRPTLNGLVASALTSKDFEAILSISRNFIAVHSSGRVPKVLYDHAADAAKRSNGAGGMLLAVTEPHAAMVHELMTGDDSSKYTLLITYANLILDNDARPRNWGVVERGRRSLWGGVSPSNSASKNPDLEYTNLSSMANYALRYGYAQLKSKSGDASTYATLFESLCQYLNRAPPVSAAVFLRHIQSGMSYILSDPDFTIRDYVGDRGRQNLLHSVCNQPSFVLHLF